VQGAQGPEVAEMQQLLIKLGVGRLAQFGATGNFLDVTAEAVGLFQDQVRQQRDATMVVDRECGPVTWGWLYFLAG
jgi:peptidoglycan hydrolase-like protein with peptidoglycan-binding domain